jgi:hypothetical protein
VNIQNNDIRLFINDTGVVSVANISSRLTKMSFSVSSTEGGTLYNIINLDATSGLRILPTTAGGQDTDIGSSTDPFGTVYSNTFVGNLTGNVTGNVTGNITGTPTFPNITKSGTSGVGNIGQVDNRFGTIYAATLNATTNQATYADLAENFLEDADYELGTVLKIGGSVEVTICDEYECEAVIGVVSTNPAYLMNSELKDSVAIALKGRVPCKVKGPVRKGDILVSSDIAGYAETRRTATVNPLSVVGRSLENFDGNLGIIEILV